MHEDAIPQWSGILSFGHPEIILQIVYQIPD